MYKKFSFKNMCINTVIRKAIKMNDYFPFSKESLCWRVSPTVPFLPLHGKFFQKIFSLVGERHQHFSLSFFESVSNQVPSPLVGESHQPSPISLCGGKVLPKKFSPRGRDHQQSPLPLRERVRVRGIKYVKY